MCLCAHKSFLGRCCHLVGKWWNAKPHQRHHQAFHRSARQRMLHYFYTFIWGEMCLFCSSTFCCTVYAIITPATALHTWNKHFYKGKWQRGFWVLSQHTIPALLFQFFHHVSSYRHETLEGSLWESFMLLQKSKPAHLYGQNLCCINVEFIHYGQHADIWVVLFLLWKIKG